MAMTTRPLSPEALAREWYWTVPPHEWVLGMGDIVRGVPYLYRDAQTGQLAETPVLAVCVEHPCDAGNVPRRVKFARTYVLDEYLADNPRAWAALQEIAGGRHFDYVLLPPFPGHWDVDLLVDLGDQFAVDAAEVRPERRLAGLNEGYWQTFAWYVTRRVGRAGVTYPVPSFRTVTISPEHDGIPRPATIPLAAFAVERDPGEAAVTLRRPPPLTLTHLHRPAAGQDWWRAEWKGLSSIPGLVGYGRTPDAAIEHLVRAVRRAVAALPALDTPRPDQAQLLRRVLQQVGGTQEG
jgi:hypothetical protein